jgi:hypothetical protein
VSEATVAYDELPDVRDGLTRLERCILVTLHELQAERGGANVPTTQLYGRVVARMNVSLPDFQAALSRLIGAGVAPRTT